MWCEYVLQRQLALCALLELKKADLTSLVMNTVLVEFGNPSYEVHEDPNFQLGGDVWE